MRIICTVHIYLHIVQKDLSNLHCLKRDFIYSPFNEFQLQELNELEVLHIFHICPEGQDGLLDILQVVDLPQLFVVEHLRAEPPSTIRVLDVHVGGPHTKLCLDIVQRKNMSLV